jgi:hypothetical protein
MSRSPRPTRANRANRANRARARTWIANGGTRRRVVQAVLLLALTGALLPGGLHPAGAATDRADGGATALRPPPCDDGSPPPCGEIPDPPTTRPRPIPTTPPTTTNPPPTTGTTVPPQGPPWNVNVIKLIEDPGGLTGPVVAERFWIPHLVNAPANTLVVHLAGGPGNSIFDPIEAGTSPLGPGDSLSVPGYTLPAGYEMVLRVREGNSPGTLCRTVPRTALPASGRPLHILAAPPLTTSAADLQALVGGLTGPVDGLDPAITASVTAVTITPQADGLSLRTRGKLSIVVNGDLFKFNFEHTMVFTLAPALGPDLSYVLIAQSANAGTADVTWDQVPPPDGDGLLNLIKGGLPGQIRPKVLQKATTKVNDHIHGLQEVAWWAEQDFHISVRNVAYSTAGLTVYPSFCRLG